MITGFAIGYIVFDTVDPITPKDKNLKIISAVMLAGFYVCGLILFYVAIDSDSD